MEKKIINFFLSKLKTDFFYWLFALKISLAYIPLALGLNYQKSGRDYCVNLEGDSLKIPADFDLFDVFVADGEHWTSVNYTCTLRWGEKLKMIRLIFNSTDKFLCDNTQKL